MPLWYEFACHFWKYFFSCWYLVLMLENCSHWIKHWYIPVFLKNFLKQMHLVWYKSRIVTVCMWLLVYISRDFVTIYQDFLYSNWLLKMLKLLHSIIDCRCDVFNIKYLFTVDSSAEFKILPLFYENWEP